MTRKSPTLPLLLIFSLLAPLTIAFRADAQANAPRAEQQRMVNKMTDRLRLRARQARSSSGSPERTRVILNLSDEAAKDRARAVLETSGATINQQLDALGVMVADVPVEKLEELSWRNEVSWMSASSPR
ncbi:MAG: hypothetical protein H0U54_07705 [Acidobacteria bacterium]|nr:hypothetical protein [Acidobacteriota bacterium]